jgi:hypothetical protein
VSSSPPNSSHTPPLKIGLLVDSTNVSKYVYDFVKWAQSRPDIITITHLIVRPITPPTEQVADSSPPAGDGFSQTCADFFSKIMFRVILRIERVILKRSSLYKNHLDEFDISRLVPNKIVVAPTASHSRLVPSFGAEDVASVRALNLDVMLLCGREIFRGDILKAARLGVISVHYGDDRRNRGGPAGFWQVYLKQDTSGFTILRLTEELDGGDVLMRGNFQTQYFFLLNQAALYEKSNSYLKLVIERIARTGALTEILPKLQYSNKLFHMPGAYEALVYLERLFVIIFTNVVARLLGVDYRWGVAYSRAHWRDTIFSQSVRIKNPPFHFLADPFVVSRDGKDFCFVEDYDYRTRRANIAVYELMGDGGTRLGTVLDEPFHMSFPFIFEFKGELYMCPETSENMDVRIYKCVEFPLRWKLAKIAMKGIRAADSMFLEKNGKWWMFTNTDPTGTADLCFELSIFSSDSPLADKWEPHSQNPILVDAGRARNAGLIKDGDRHFRVSQGQGFNLYGKKSLVNEITELSDTTYLESTVSENTPSFWPQIVGTHHLHSNGTVTVFDYLVRSRISG